MALTTAIRTAEEMQTLVFADTIVLVEDFLPKIRAVRVKEILDHTCIFKYFSTVGTSQVNL